MRAEAIVDERSARFASPALFIVAALAFFLVFAGVSCNTAVARQAVQSVAGLGGSTSGVSNAELNRCLSALQNVDVISYTGFTLAFGGAPSVLTSPPSACPQGSSSLPGGQTVVPTDSEAKLGVQPLALAGFLAIAVSILVCLLALARIVGAPLRALLTTLLAMVAFVLVLVEQSHLTGAIDSTLDAQATGSGAPFSVSSFFNIDTGIGYVIALAALGVAALYSAATAFFGNARGEPHPPPLPAAEPPPAPG